MNRHALAILLIASITICSSCTTVESDENIARKNCSSCHLFPSPSLLDKNTWDRGVFPEMALRMGRDISKLPRTGPEELNEILRALPPAPLVSEEVWQAIRKYYLSEAPDSLHVPPHDASPLYQFTAEAVSLPIRGRTMLTMVKTHGGDLFVGTRAGTLYRVRQTLFVQDSFQIESPAADMIFENSDMALVSCMGIMDPNDRRAGTVAEVKLSGADATVIVDSLKRPVDIATADFNNDARRDLLVSAFGNFTGALIAFEKLDTGYREHVVHNFPGTRKTIVEDFNKDGLPDILALITQGDERVALFTNRGKFRFSYQVLLKFPPVYGSSYLELCDFNDDGHKDLLYTNGDNADYSMVLKPYHGIRIFLNDGKNQFSESWFYPMHGASMARGVDFDQDGDTDIAAISFFPDFENHPEHGFLYLENHQGEFTAFETPLAGSGRWITLESTDIDGDKDVDLILGALAFPTGVPDSLYYHWGEKKISLLVLRNNLR